MELSQRIKTARLEAGLSQRQLCGEVITRNMLSLIESGRARPSMDTLRHFSQVLGKPMSYFLEEDAVTSPNQAVMQTAEQAYGAGDVAGALAALEGYRAPDPVFDQTRYLLEVLTCQALAEKAVTEGKNAYALRLLDRADAATARTIYAPSGEKTAILRWRADPSTAVTAKLSVSQPLTVLADAALQEKDYPRAVRLLDAVPEQAPRWHLLRGMAALALGDFQTADTHLTVAEAAFPRQAVPLLEQCCLAQGDYKRAYEYAKKQLP